MKLKRFKGGDVVECIDATNTKLIRKGDIYNVLGSNGMNVYVSSMGTPIGWYDNERFRLKKKKSKIKALESEVKQLKARIKELEPEWPQKRDDIYFVNTYCAVGSEKYNEFPMNVAQDSRIAVGNYFQTEEEAQAAAEKIKAVFAEIRGES